MREGREHLNDMVDAAVDGRPTSMTRDRIQVAAVDAGRLADALIFDWADDQPMMCLQNRTKPHHATTSAIVCPISIIMSGRSFVEQVRAHQRSPG